MGERWILFERSGRKPVLLVLVSFVTEAEAMEYATDVLGRGSAGYSTYCLKPYKPADGTEGEDKQ